ncbi:hypothetical protein MANES_15G084650v8 [Manihot esculenta]|uniref:Uncharacterized protein n=1 Tax=Manihot esculenta TaxID=3983 RepID=A0ACB7GBN1_MANES|nr:hypothetical protein MANES_15G084650v8 [Manihot esculenta]
MIILKLWLWVMEMAKSSIMSLVIANLSITNANNWGLWGQCSSDLSLVKMVQWCLYNWKTSSTICQFVRISQNLDAKNPPLTALPSSIIGCEDCMKYQLACMCSSMKTL